MSNKLPRIRRQYHGIHAPIAGLRYDLGSTVIPEQATSDCRNVTFEDGAVRKCAGTRALGNTDATPLIGNSVMDISVYHKDGTTPKLMAHTISQSYYYDEQLGHFQNMTEGEVIENCEDVWAVNANVTCAVDTNQWTGTNCIKNTISASFTTGVASYEDFTSDDFSATTGIHFLIKSSVATSAGDLQILLDNTSGCVSPLETLDVPALTADTWTAVYVAFSAPSALSAVVSIGLNVATDLGAQVVYLDDIRAVVPHTGDEDNPVCTVNMLNGASPPVGIHIFSNGVDTIKMWNMTDSGAVDLTNATGYIPQWMLFFGQRLCLYNVYDATTYNNRRVRWSVAGDPLDWSGTGSGAEDLRGALDDGDEIMRAEKLADYAVIYGKRSVAAQTYRNDVNQPFIFSQRVTKVGLAAPKALVNIKGHEHIFMGFENIYSYKGGRDVEVLGEPIRDELYDLIHPKYVHRSFMVHHEDESLVRLYVTDKNGTTPNLYFEFDLKERAWSRGARNYTCGNKYTNVEMTAWSDLTGGQWGGLTGTRWDDLTTAAVAPVAVYGDSSGIVYERDVSLYDLAGTLIDSWWDSKDFVNGDRYKPVMTDWMELDFEARGDNVDVFYSTDAGESYTQLNGGSSVSLVDEWKQYRLDFDVSSPKIRFRFRNNTASESFAVRWIEVGYVPGSDRAHYEYT